MAVPLTCKSTVPLCLLCASSLADSKQRRNVSHGDGLVKGVLKDLLRGFLKENLTVDESSSSDELLTQYLKFSDVVRKYVRSLKKIHVRVCCGHDCATAAI